MLICPLCLWGTGGCFARAYSFDIDFSGVSAKINSMAKPKDPREIFQNYPHPDKFGEWLGYKVTHVDRDKGETRVELTIREDHLSPAGKVHGGVVSGLFDSACGATTFATMKKGDFCSTVELKVNYLKPIVTGDQLVAETKVVFRGKRLCVLQSFLYRKKEAAPVAMATATFNIVSKK